MTLQSLAHAAQQHLQDRCGIAVKRSHVHELTAAAFGHGSWAALRAGTLLANGGLGHRVAERGPLLEGRVLQLGYPQAKSASVANELVSFLRERHVTAMTRPEVDALLARLPDPHPPIDQGSEGDEDQVELEDEDPEQGAGSISSERDLSRSPLLVDELGRIDLDPHVHHRVAIALRCARPNSYLYDESRRGRVLTTIEQAWADQYLRDRPRYEAYEHHLRRAALGSVRQAALDYAAAFDRPEYYDAAERLGGSVNARQMVELAQSEEGRRRWLRVSAEEGSMQSLHELARYGDDWALGRLARAGDVDAMRSLADQAVSSGDAVAAWAVQYFALSRRKDLTKDDYRAYHSEGSRAGQFYDSDFGGPMHVEGSDAIHLPELNPPLHSEARALAKAFAAGRPLRENAPTRRG